MFRHAYQQLLQALAAPMLPAQRQQGSPASRAYQFEECEDRTVPAIIGPDANNVITITGNNSANTISVSVDTNTNKYIINDGIGAPNISIAVNSNIKFLIDAHGGNDTVTLNLAADQYAGATIDGGDGNDTIVGGAGNDLLDGGNNNDNLQGGDGDDTFQISGGTEGANDVYDGGSGMDTIVNTAGVDLQINNFVADNNIEFFNGANKAINGNDSGNQLDFSALEFIDVTQVDGGNGNDTIWAAKNGAKLLGGNQNDLLIGSDSNDNLFGENNNDTLQGNGGDDLLDGGNNNDNLQGGAGNDTFRISGGMEGTNDVYDGGSGMDTIVNTAGVDLQINNFVADNNIEFFNGANKAINGDGNSNQLNFSALDFINVTQVDGGSGDDTIWAAKNGAKLLGGNQNDTLIGSDSNDTLLGEGNDDTLQGNGGDDLLNGGNNNDNLQGGTGNDTFQICGGMEGTNDVYDGGSGMDTIVNTAGVDLQINKFVANNSIEFFNGANKAINGDGNSNQLNFSALDFINVTQVDGGSGGDTI